MHIIRFQKIKNHRIFRDFAWPGTGLPDFARFNLIYGWNGAGKTTFSNLFRSLQNRMAIAEGEVGVRLDDERTITQADFPSAVLPQIRVFNRDTVDRSIFEVPGKELQPIYYLGENSAKLQEEIEALKLQKNEVRNKVGSLQSRYSDRLKEVEQFETDQARTIKNLLTGPSSAYNNYNAGNFRGEGGALLEQAPGVRLTSDQHKNLLSTARGTPMLRVNRPAANFPDAASLQERVQAVIQRSLVSNVIEELQSDPVLSQWVASGLALHRGAQETLSSSVCHFCKQPIPPGRLERLEEHFNDQYASFQVEIAQLLLEVSAARQQAKNVSFPDEGLLYPELRDAYVQEVKQYNSHQHTADNFFLAMERALTAKQKEPFKKLELSRFMLSNSSDDTERSGLMAFFEGVMLVGTTLSAYFASGGFGKSCALIDQHNAKTDKFSEQQKDARSTLARDCIFEVLNEYRAKLEKRDQVKEEKESAESQSLALSKRIEQLEQENRTHQPAADELTRDMASYLGRNELRFEARNAGYVITRNGQLAQHLSEGERTAIAFMYFLKSLQDKDFDLKNSIVVIDDPVSSLDANSLYCAFGFMKERIRNANQVFVLTHNFTFFRQVKNWFDHEGKIYGRNNTNLLTLKNVRYYMLKSHWTEQGRSAALAVLDDLLYVYESEYHHMFKLVLDGSKSAENAPMENFYALPNMARRLLEAVLAFKQPVKTGELYQQIKDIEFDEAKKARILRFTNTYSHHGLMAEPLHDLSVLAETPAILRDVLELVKRLDAEHFESMCSLCGSSPPATIRA